MPTTDLTAALDAMAERAAVLPDDTVEHTGDCAGSLCATCGHCLHAITPCDHECEPGAGCSEAADGPEVQVRRDLLAAVAVLRDLATQAQEWSVTAREMRDNATTGAYRTPYEQGQHDQQAESLLAAAARVHQALDTLAR